MNQKSTDPNSLFIAHQLADTYARIGVATYNQIAADFGKAMAEGNNKLSRFAIEGIPAAMLMAFATELFLKCITFQRTASYPKNSHNLLELFNNLPPEAQKSVRDEYEEISISGRKSLKVKYEMLSEEAPLPEPAPETSSLSFDQALEHVSPMFVKLRYLHENVTTGFSSEINFGAVLTLAAACSNTLTRFKGGNLKIEYPKNWNG